MYGDTLTLAALFIGLPLSVVLMIAAAWLVAEPKGSAEYRALLKTRAREDGRYWPE